MRILLNRTVSAEISLVSGPIFMKDNIYRHTTKTIKQLFEAENISHCPTKFQISIYLRMFCNIAGHIFVKEKQEKCDKIMSEQRDKLVMSCEMCKSN